MSDFRRTLDERQPDPSGRRWVYVPYDQLTDQVGPLSQADPSEVGIVMVESTWKASQRPYHKQKLALVLANQRQFALEQAARGVAVDHRTTDGPFSAALAEAAAEHGPLTVMRPAEKELRVDLATLGDAVRQVPHEGWLTTSEDFADLGSPPWRMDAFYRNIRRRTGVLMDDRGKPVGGRFSFDGDNREVWKGDPPAPEPPTFSPDAVTLEVCELVATRFADHPGALRADTLPTTAADARALWSWAMRECMHDFGPYEDAMTTRSKGLFHTRIAPLLNNLRLLARDVVRDVALADIPLNSKEGFIRQVLGWREFVRHVHEATDGFADLDDPLARTEPLPAAFWEGASSGLHCLDQAVDDVWADGWTHHIPRLMVLSNLATLLDLSPRELSDWFWVGFIDAYDWVVEPNVLGMGTFATGPLMTTKPYISGSAYLKKMGPDVCAACAFDPKKTCPITHLYWAFLARHEDTLGGIQRMAMPMRSLAKRAPDKRETDRETYERVIGALRRGERLEP
jgi:deoxyribodipyrimidine photolyase-related protein